MKMIIGGAFQGKLSYAKELYPDIEWVNGQKCNYDILKTCDGIYNFQEYIRRFMQEEKEHIYMNILNQLSIINPDIIIITDEIGYGLVPIDSFERRYREQVGRICTRLALASKQVDRVVCGIGTTIKREDF